MQKDEVHGREDRPRTRFLWLVQSLVLCIAMAAAPALAHPILNASAILTVSRDGRVELTVRHDALAFALNDTRERISDEQMIALMRGPPSDLERALEDGQQRFASGFELRA